MLLSIYIICCASHALTEQYGDWNFGCGLVSNHGHGSLRGAGSTLAISLVGRWVHPYIVRQLWLCGTCSDTTCVRQGGFESGFEVSAGGGGQTREHAQLARSLGVEQLAVVVSKLDTCDFSQQRFLDIQATLLPFLKGCGFRPGAIQWLPAVGPTGQNLVKAPTEPQLAWFKVSPLVHRKATQLSNCMVQWLRL